MYKLIMENTITATPKPRINSIDALRGFALIGIMLLHCMEHFDLTYYPKLDSPFWQAVDTKVYEVMRFLFQGKAYAIFSLLFGLSFFMQMDSQAAKGKDFRGRFFWRLVILLAFGYINGLVYMGEFFVIYALLGMILIPLWKVPSRWLAALCVLLFLQIPQLIQFASLLNNNVPNAPTPLVTRMNELYVESAHIYTHGSVGDILSFNAFKGQGTKLIWFVNVYRYLQLAGLFIAGMLIGRSGIHKNPDKMYTYSKKAFPYAFAWFLAFYLVVLALPYSGIEGYALRAGKNLFTTYANLGMMMAYICGFIWIYHRTVSGRRMLDRLAPVGRMSVTNYMMQSLMGVILFYGFGFNLAVRCSFLECAIVGLLVCLLQILYSNWWMKRFHYGPMEWLWRTLTWMRHVPMTR